MAFSFDFLSLPLRTELRLSDKSLASLAVAARNGAVNTMVGLLSLTRMWLAKVPKNTKESIECKEQKEKKLQEEHEVRSAISKTFVSGIQTFENLQDHPEVGIWKPNKGVPLLDFVWHPNIQECLAILRELLDICIPSILINYHICEPHPQIFILALGTPSKFASSHIYELFEKINIITCSNSGNCFKAYVIILVDVMKIEWQLIFFSGSAIHYTFHVGDLVPPGTAIFSAMFGVTQLIHTGKVQFSGK